MSDEDDVDEDGGETIPKGYGPEGERRWPAAAVRKIGAPPTTLEVLKVHAWVVGGEAAYVPAYPIDDQFRGGMWDDSLLEDMICLLFPTPYAVETDGELRAMLAKLVVADGLWADFRPGRPFTEYKRGLFSVYDNEEAEQLGQMMANALEMCGPHNVWKQVEALVNVLTMPG